jgi:hypothetical protein
MEVIERSIDEAGAVHVMLEWLKVCNTMAMEVIERSMDEAGAVHVMLVGGSLRVLRLLPPLKLVAMI